MNLSMTSNEIAEELNKMAYTTPSKTEEETKDNV